VRSKKVFPIKKYHERLLSLYQRQLKKWRNDIIRTKELPKNGIMRKTKEEEQEDSLINY